MNTLSYIGLGIVLGASTTYAVQTHRTTTPTPACERSTTGNVQLDGPIKAGQAYALGPDRKLHRMLTVTPTSQDGTPIRSVQ
jgi:hypothetical protein